MSAKTRLKQLEKRRDNTGFTRPPKVIETWGAHEDGTGYLMTRQTLDEKTGAYVTTFEHGQAVNHDNQ